jgi:multiple sugar transport system substrate-binding protein
VREEILPSSTDEQHQFYVINLAAHADDFDVVDMDIIWVPEFARAGWLWPLSSQVSTTELATLSPAALRADRLGGQLYAVPWFLDVGVLLYRKDLLAKYGFGAPQTYPELLHIARTILDGEEDKRLTGFVWQGMQYEGLVCSSLEFIRGNGGDLMRRDASLAFTEPATLEALQFMSDLIRVHKATPPLVTTLNEESSRNIFQSGRAIFMRNWPYTWKLVNEPGSPVAGRVGITSVAHFPGKSSAPTLGGFHLGVNANSRHKSEAALFVRYMIRQDSQKEVLLKLGVLPARTDIYGDPEVQQALPFPSELLPTLERAQPRPVTPYYMMISQIVQPELSGVVAGLRPPERAMQSAEKQVRHLLEAQ